MRRLIPVLLVLAAGPLVAAEVYKSVDENGNVVYSDRPGPGAEVVNVEAPYLGGGPAPRTSPTLGRSDSPDGGDAAADDTEETPEERAARRAQNCAAAQERSERYATSHRLYRLTDDGEREYLSSAQIDEARAQAAADVERWCN